ncbi:hypothetical protein SAMN05216238_10513 [Lentibacillus persicus]|uniref:Dolichyl-phosphate-mannose-protein mannosyltransferase n=1 Tax=Lentibacillus persicus TaxID=640948 RepID=A0A1I1VUH7_9BACI|nr:hypothetical protein [Lentibacillus persicus]SFD86349.1 hypothetical protein SAMN05216238_10513 [Lentibacillus persicus]
MKRLMTPDVFWLAVLFILYSGALLVRAAFDPEGYVTSDSAHYMQLAQNLLNGDGLSTANYVEGMSTYFATWPVGYPVLIAIVSFVTGLGVFWAAKVVNIIFLALCFVVLQRLFKERSAIVALLFSISTVSYLFVHTWSEVPFLFGLLWLVYGLARYIETEKPRYIVHLFFASLFLFLMRYIGLIGAGIVGLLGFYYLFRKKWRPTLLCWFSGSAVIMMAGVYLLINWVQTGKMTGVERVPKAETGAEFYEMLREAVSTEWDLFTIELGEASLYWTFGLILAALMFFTRIKHLRAFLQVLRGNFLVPGLFLFVGSVYFIAIVAMRWTAYFDAFNFRLLGPATFMFALFFVSWAAGVEGKTWTAWKRALVVIFGVTFIVNVGQPVYMAITSDEPTYKETIAEVEETYRAIPEASIVAFENVHARYLRMDIQFVKVHFRPYFAEPESIDDFRERITPNSAAGAYLQRKSLKGYDYHKTFDNKMGQGDGIFVPLGQ